MKILVHRHHWVDPLIFSWQEAKMKYYPTWKPVLKKISVEVLILSVVNICLFRIAGWKRDSVKMGCKRSYGKVNGFKFLYEDT